MIEFCDVTYKYHYDDFSVLEHTSFKIEDGVNTVLCNFQSGKTTICKLILGLLRPHNGKVFVDGKEPCECSPEVLYLPQKPVFFEHRSALFNLNYPAKVRKTKPQNDVYALADRFGLTRILSRKVRTLSADEKARLALARGLTFGRQIVLDDGFSDNNIIDKNMLRDIYLSFRTAVVFTSVPQNAVGRTLLLDGKQTVFQGEANVACEKAKSLWVGVPREGEADG